MAIAQRSILKFWLPLAATWLMMSVEGPFLAAIIARLADPKFNLAAYGVAFAFAVLVEAPVIMIMSASTALAEDSTSFRRLRVFTYALNASVTALMLVVLIPPVFRLLMLQVIALPEDVARLVYVSLWIFLPWPGAIGYRRFYQGLLIRDGKTQFVAYGTVLRLATMAVTAVVLYLTIAPPGAWVGAAALSVGVSFEALASRLMADESVRRLLKIGHDAKAGSTRLGYGRIARFYYPLALTSLIGLAVHPMLTFFMGRAPSPVESLAVFPVVGALVFVFRSLGLSYQEVAIALMGKGFENLRELGRFGLTLGLFSSGGLALVAVTPMAGVWFQTVSGLSTDLTALAIVPTVLLIPIPFLSVILSYQRGILVVAHVTGPITWATVIEVVTVALGFVLLSWQFGLLGVTAAATALLVGRVAGVLYLIGICWRLTATRRRVETEARVG